MNKTIEYYNQNAQKYFDSTINGNMKNFYDTFLKYLDTGNYILDFGCGSGRDTKYFLDNGYKVKAIDGSKELCELASVYTGINIECMNFMDFEEKNTFDGAWAMASLLHLNKEDFIKVLGRIRNSLKINGIFYMSLKNGYASEYDEKGRYFTYYTLEEILKIINDLNYFGLLEYKNTLSVTNDKESKSWNNFVLRRK